MNMLKLISDERVGIHLHDADMDEHIKNFKNIDNEQTLKIENLRNKLSDDERKLIDTFIETRNAIEAMNYDFIYMRAFCDAIAFLKEVGVLS